MSGAQSERLPIIWVPKDPKHPEKRVPIEVHPDDYDQALENLEDAIKHPHYCYLAAPTFIENLKRSHAIRLLSRVRPDPAAVAQHRIRTNAVAHPHPRVHKVQDRRNMPRLCPAIRPLPPPRRA